MWYTRVSESLPLRGPMKRCAYFGLGGTVALVLASIVDYAFCARAQSRCLWGLPAEKTERACDFLVQHVGRLLGVRYGYLPYFPNSGTRMFLSGLGFVLPWLLWFLLGVSAYFITGWISVAWRATGKG